jgi:hypothetical protein
MMASIPKAPSYRSLSGEGAFSFCEEFEKFNKSITIEEELLRRLYFGS